MINNDNHQPATEVNLRLIVRDEVAALIRLHATTCRFVLEEHPARLRQIETSYARLTGFMLGSGLLGGTFGAAIAKIL